MPGWKARIGSLIGAVALVVAGSIAIPAGASAAALPAVNMEAVLKAAQWDPQKTGSAITPGSGPSVLLVEKALQAKGLLAASYVDGHYGTSTVTAYTRWQKQLGYTGLGANGLPGEASLTKLGDRPVHGHVGGRPGRAGRLRRHDGRRPHRGHADRGERRSSGRRCGWTRAPTARRRPHLGGHP